MWSSSFFISWLFKCMSCAKTTEPIEMPFRMLTYVGPRNHVLDGVDIPSW